MQLPRRTSAGRYGRVAPLAAGVLLLSSVLSGCGVLKDRSDRYVLATEGPELKMPEGTGPVRFEQIMPIRELAEGDSGRLYAGEIPRPPDMTSDILQENYVVEELDGQAWLLVNDVPGRLWPQVTAYLNERGLGVAHDSPQLGVLQTDLVNYSRRARTLLELPDQPGRLEPLLLVQVRVAPGIRRKTTEIHVGVRALTEAPDGLLAWKEPGSQSLALQKKLLADLGEFLRAREQSKSFSRAALGLTGEPLVRLISSDEVPVAIRMQLSYGRAWAEVNRALSDAGVAVVDLDRSRGWLHVDFRSPAEKSPGWFGWFADRDKPRHTHTISVTEQGGAIMVRASQQEDYEGEQSAADLLSRLFEYLY